ncbi:MAG: cobalamin-dependent protein [Pseudomonadota bacterium]|jgi:methanogenic corrinoid protein MtbC1
MASVMRIDHIGASAHPQRRTGPGRESAPAHDLAGFRHRADMEYARSLTRLIESEIIPRLLVAHSNGAHGVPADPRGGAVLPDDVATFAPLTLQVEADELLEHVDRLIARGVSHETLLVDLLAPAARLLGELWEDDRCDFVDVTMGLWRLQQVVHEISGRSTYGLQQGPGPVRRALFASLEGDQHSFGTVVIDELFGSNGWTTHRINEASTSELMDRVRSEWFDLAGLTITCDCHIAPLPSIVRALRVSSRNPRICVMVGGRVFINNAELAVSVGADGTAPDARIALGVASDLVDAVAREAVSPMSG